MIMFSFRILIILSLIVGLSIPTELLSAEQHSRTKPILFKVPHLQNLLREEMRAVLPAMNKIVTALPIGDWQTVATTAAAIHNSFIMQQKLTAKDRELLQQNLPDDFIHLDQTFHRQANKLQQAAERHDAELSVFYVSKMLNSCMDCHQRFAPQRFPNLKVKIGHEPHH
jgi:hypothetical protein